MVFTDATSPLDVTWRSRPGSGTRGLQAPLRPFSSQPPTRKLEIKSKEEHGYVSEYQKAVRRREEFAMRELSRSASEPKGSGAPRMMMEPAWMDKYNHVKELKDGDLVEVVGQHLYTDVRRYLRRDGGMPLSSSNEVVGEAIARSLGRTRDLQSAINLIVEYSKRLDEKAPTEDKRLLRELFNHAVESYVAIVKPISAEGHLAAYDLLVDTMRQLEVPEDEMTMRARIQLYSSLGHVGAIDELARRHFDEGDGFKLTSTALKDCVVALSLPPVSLDRVKEVASQMICSRDLAENDGTEECNLVVRSLSMQTDVAGALEIIQLMKANDVPRNEVTYLNLLHPAAFFPDKMIHSTETAQLVLDGIGSEEDVKLSFIGGGLVIKSYVRRWIGDNIDLEIGREVSELVYQRFKEQGMVPSVVWFSSLLKAFATFGHAENVEFTLNKMVQMGVPIDKYHHASLIQAYNKAGMHWKALQHLRDMESEGTPLNIPSYTSVIIALAKACEFELALETLMEMPRARLQPNLRTYTGLLHHILKEQRYEIADFVYDRMRGSPLDHVFCETITERYAEAEKLDCAQMVHNFAVEHGFEMAPVIRDSSDVIKDGGGSSQGLIRAGLETIHYYLSDFHGGIKAPYARVMIVSAMNHFRANRDRILEWRIVTGRGKHQNSGAALVRESILELLGECGIPVTSQVNIRVAGMITVPKSSLEDFLERSSSLPPDGEPGLSPWGRAMYGLRQQGGETSRKLVTVLNAAQFYHQYAKNNVQLPKPKAQHVARKDSTSRDVGASGRKRGWREAAGSHGSSQKLSGDVINLGGKHRNGRQGTGKESMRYRRFDGSNPEDVVPLKRRIREYFEKQRLQNKEGLVLGDTWTPYSPPLGEKQQHPSSLGGHDEVVDSSSSQYVSSSTGSESDATMGSKQTPAWGDVASGTEREFSSVTAGGFAARKQRSMSGGREGSKHAAKAQRETNAANAWDGNISK